MSVNFSTSLLFQILQNQTDLQIQVFQLTLKIDVNCIVNEYTWSVWHGDERSHGSVRASVARASAD